MPPSQPGKGGRFKRLQEHYRLVVMEDETLELRASVKLSLLNVYVAISVVLTVLTVLIFCLIYFTPIKNYLVGYNQVNVSRSVLEQENLLDSLLKVTAQQDQWAANISSILRGEVDTSRSRQQGGGQTYDNLDLNNVPAEDLALREQVTRADYFNLRGAEEANSTRDFRDGVFFLPLEGVVSAAFDPAEGHFGVDIVSRENAPVKAVRDGRVIDTYWDSETGNVIVLQHEFGLISMYKHNSSLLRKVGNFVRAGDAIAVVGNTGELSSGPHLHFELWHDRAPLDPEDFLTF
jgi:murein DD-endopeptidase MepM/ murein hydrolase activator NlpD